MAADIGVGGQLFVDGQDISPRLSGFRFQLVSGNVDTTRLRTPDRYRTHLVTLNGGTIGFTGDMPSDQAEALEAVDRYITGKRTPFTIMACPYGAEAGYLAVIGKSLKASASMDTETEGVLSLNADFEITAASPGVRFGTVLFTPNATATVDLHERWELTFNAADVNQFFAFRAKGTTALAQFQLSSYASDAALRAGVKSLLEGMAEYTGKTVTVTTTTPLSGTNNKSAVLLLEWSDNTDLKNLEILSGAVHNFNVIGGDSGNYKLNNGANFTLGISEDSLRSNQQALTGQYAAVIVKGSSTAAGGGIAEKLVVTNTASSAHNGDYLKGAALNGRDAFYLNGGATVGTKVVAFNAGVWALGLWNGSTTGTVLSSVLTASTSTLAQPPLGSDGDWTADVKHFYNGWLAGAMTAPNGNSNADIAENANDGSNPGWIQAGGGFSTPDGLVKQPTTPSAIDGYFVYSRNFNSSPKDFKLQGSNDNTNWTDLDTKTNQDTCNTVGIKYTLTTTATYAYYRLWVSAVQGSGVRLVVTEFQILKSATPAAANFKSYFPVAATPSAPTKSGTGATATSLIEAGSIAVTVTNAVKQDGGSMTGVNVISAITNGPRVADPMGVTSTDKGLIAVLQPTYVSMGGSSTWIIQRETSANNWSDVLTFDAVTSNTAQFKEFPAGTTIQGNLRARCSAVTGNVVVAIGVARKY